MSSNNTISCILIDDEAIAREILESHLSKIKDITIVAQCKNALEAVNVLNNQTVDLLFLDINMPDMSGISLARSISKSTKVIFTTAYREYAVDGFDLQAVDYLLKPISLERLVKSIQKYRQENIGFAAESDSMKEYIVVRSDRKMVKIDFQDIVYVESYSDYIKIHLKEKTVVTRETISSIEDKLPKQQFIRIHRSFIVSITFIDSFTAEYVEIDTKSLPISRSYRSSFLSKME